MRKQHFCEFYCEITLFKSICAFSHSNSSNCMRSATNRLNKKTTLLNSHRNFIKIQLGHILTGSLAVILCSMADIWLKQPNNYKNTTMRCNVAMLLVFVYRITFCLPTLKWMNGWIKWSPIHAYILILCMSHLAWLAAQIIFLIHAALHIRLCVVFSFYLSHIAFSHNWTKN